MSVETSPDACFSTSLDVGTWWQVSQYGACAWCAPVPGRGVPLIPWHVVHEFGGPWEWQLPPCEQPTFTGPPAKSPPWHSWQRASGNLFAAIHLPWKSALVLSAHPTGCSPVGASGAAR